MSIFLEVIHEKINGNVLITFKNDYEVFCLYRKIDVAYDDNLTFFYDALTKIVDAYDIEADAIINGVLLEKSMARMLWDELIKDDYSRVDQLESIMLNKSLDNQSIVYKIKDVESGLYSVGKPIRKDGESVMDFSGSGRCFFNIGSIKANLTRYKKKYEHLNIKIVVYKQVNEMTVEEVYDK